MSFMMMTGEPGFVGAYDGAPMQPAHSFSMLPMMNPAGSLDPAAMVSFGGGGARPSPPPPSPSPSPSVLVAPNASDQLPLAMMMPSMTMTIQSEPGGSSAIELSTNMAGAGGSSLNSSAPLLLQRPQVHHHHQTSASQNKWHSQQQLPVQNDHFDEPSEQFAGGEQYYSSPWQARQQPLASPAKLIRNERLRGQYQRPRQQYSQQQHLRAPARQVEQQPISQQTVSLNAPTQAPASGAKLQQQVPILVIKNQWRPAQREPPARQQQTAAAPSPQVQPPQRSLPPPPPQPQQQPQPARANSAQEFEEFVPVGPPQMMAVYQDTRDGQLHMTPPPPLPVAPSARLRQPESAAFDQDDLGRANSASPADSSLNSEVQTVATQNGGLEQQQQGADQMGGEAPAAMLHRLPERERQPAAAPGNSKQPAPPSRAQLAAPVVKGKQQQQQQQGKQPEPFTGGGGSGY